MSHLKYSVSLPSGSAPHKRWPLIWGGVLTLAIVMIAAILIPLSSEDNVIRAPELDMDALGAQEWSDISELNHQSLDDPLDDLLADETESPSEKSPDDPFHIHGSITRNQTLFIAMKNQGLDVGDIHQVIASLEGVVDFKKTRPGDKYEIELDVDRRITRFTYEISPEDISVSIREGNGYTGKKLSMNRESIRLRLKGVLTTSLYQSFVDLGESGELAAHFMRLFKYDMDFSSSSQRGDEFTVLVDKIMLNGKFYRYGRVWAATYESVSHSKLLEAYYYESDNEEYSGYYDEEGRALKRTFLKTPVVGCQMTSPYNLKRMHPILKRIRPHYGIDWACPTGTPIMAFADGIVTFADWKGGNGNLLVIQHGHGYTSLYAHLYGFARNIKKGTRVRQGQVVAMLGNTGISTGPHLHFAVKVGDKYIDPASIDTSHAWTLTGNRLAAFQTARNDLRLALNSTEPSIAQTGNSNSEKSEPSEEILHNTNTLSDDSNTGNSKEKIASQSYSTKISVP